MKLKAVLIIIISIFFFYSFYFVYSQKGLSESLIGLFFLFCIYISDLGIIKKYPNIKLKNKDSITKYEKITLMLGLTYANICIILYVYHEALNLSISVFLGILLACGFVPFLFLHIIPEDFLK